MSAFLIGIGCAATFGGEEYAADDRGVIEIPPQFDDLAANSQGLSRYVDGPASEVDGARSPGRPRKAGVESAAAAPEAAEAAAE